MKEIMNKNNKRLTLSSNKNRIRQYENTSHVTIDSREGYKIVHHRGYIDIVSIDGDQQHVTSLRMELLPQLVCDAMIPNRRAHGMEIEIDSLVFGFLEKTATGRKQGELVNRERWQQIMRESECLGDGSEVATGTDG